MTENEAIEELKYDCNELGKAIPCDTSWGKSFENAYAMAIKALEEVQQYRKHGLTVENALDNMCDLAASKNLIEEYRAIGTVEECRAAVEKQIPKKPKHTYIKHGKHTWKKDKNGEIDNFAWDFDYHNGVVCEVCGETVCVHCNPNYDKLEDCEENIYSCPVCGKEVYYNQKHCDCGQKLDLRNE